MKKISKLYKYNLKEVIEMQINWGYVKKENLKNIFSMRKLPRVGACLLPRVITFSPILAALFFMSLQSVSAESSQKEPLQETIRSVITDLVEDNAAFTHLKTEEHFQEFSDIQNPRVTMVMCSDSRVQVDNFSQGAENDIFIARNIGNQFVTTKGSVEYGVLVLKTPVLIFVGHSHCGAIKAAMTDNSQIPEAIQKELDTLDVKSAHDAKEGVVLNVNYQVDKALDEFMEKVSKGKLAIIGAVYDFRNDYGYGNGQLIIVNLNGNTNVQEIRDSHYFDRLDKVVVGIQKDEK